MAITQTLVVFDWSDLSGGGVSGSDDLTLSETISDGAITLRPPAVTPTAKLDGMGRAALIVPANDDLTTVPTGTFYKHTGRIGQSVARETKAVTSLGQATVISGAGVPSSGTGTDGEWYVDTNTGNAYGPKLTTWPSPILIGNWDNAVPDGQIYWAQLSQFFPDWGSGGSSGGGGGGSDGGVSIESVLRTSAPNQLRTMTGNLVGGGFRGTSWGAGQVLGDLAVMEQSNGWIIDTIGWTFISQWQFSTPGIGGVFVYPKGTCVSWKESSVQKYGVVQGSSFNGTNTIVSLIPTSDYLMAANPDAQSTLYSFGHPSGFPTNFTYPGSTTQNMTTTGGSASATLSAPNPNIRVGMEVTSAHIPAGVTVAAVSGTSVTLSTGTSVTAGTATSTTFNIFTGFSAAPAVASNWWSVDSGICTVNLATFGTGTSNSTAMNALLPIAALGGNRTALPAVVTDNNTSQIGMLTVSAAATAGQFNVGTVTGFTATGNKGASVLVSYPI